jgi:hypothetical protein
MLEYRLDYFSYFGTSARTTLSDAERRAGLVPAFTVLEGKPLTEITTGESPLVDTVTLPVKGQGTVAVKLKPSHYLAITLSPSQQLKEGETALQLEVTNKTAKFYAVTTTTKEEIIEASFPKGVDAAKLIPEVDDLFWLSVDQKNGFIRYGKTYRAAAVTYLLAKVVVEDELEKPGPFNWIKKLKHVSISCCDPQEANVSFLFESLLISFHTSHFLGA